MDFEKPKMPSPEEMAKIEKERALSDAELLKGGAEYKFDEKGNRRLNATDEQIEKAGEEMEKNQWPYNLESPKTIDEQRQEFIKNELKGAQKLIEMQNFPSEKAKVDVIEKLRSSAENLFDSWAANIKAGITPEDIKFLDEAESPYNYMGMSADEKMKLYDLQDRIKMAKEEIKQEKSNSGAMVNETWYVGAKKNPDGSLDLSKAAIFKPKKTFLKTEADKSLKEGEEKLEGEKLFQYQIENNSHVSAKNLKEYLALFVRSIDDMRTNFQATKEELSEILYRNGIEYEEDKEININEKDKKILQPILDFRQELDKWNTLTEPKIDDFRKRLIGYMEDTFGIKTQEPNEGENYNSKEMQAIKVEETKNEFLNNKIKKIFSPGFKINDKLFDYYKKWLVKKEQEMKKKHQSIKDTVSRQEFDKIIDEDQSWLRQHSFTKSIRPTRVEIYKYKV